MAKNGKDWALRILIGVCLFLAGFVINEVRGSQKTVGQVRENTTNITAIENNVSEMKEDFREMRGDIKELLKRVPKRE